MYAVRNDIEEKILNPYKQILLITLRYLASGESQQPSSNSFRVVRRTISNIFAETADTIFVVLIDSFLKTPSSEEDWKSLSEKFEEVWNFLNVT